MGAKVVELKAKLSSERELREKSQCELARKTVEKGQLAKELKELKGSSQVLTNKWTVWNGKFWSSKMK